MKYKIKYTTQFKKDYRLAKRQNKNPDLLMEVVALLAEGKTLPAKYNEHPLIGNWKGFRECHILPDWLLIYKIEDDILVLTLTRTGSHSDLFQR